MSPQRADVLTAEQTQVRSSDAEWSAIMSRSRDSDGEFVFAVRSTGVYCAPSCPSRRPRRENVVFFSDADRAEAAGFRACLRCEPRLRTGHPKLILSLCADIESRPGSDWSLRVLSDRAGLSPSHLQRTFKEAVGVTPREYVEAVRFSKFRELLRADLSVRESTYKVGRSTSSWPYRKDTGSILGMEAKGGSGQDISFATADSSQGKLLVAWTAKGICFVAIDDTLEGLTHALSEEFPGAEIHPISRAAAGWMKAILDVLEKGDSSGTSALPLDIRTTAFRWKVWKTLLSIPPGETLTYGEVAARMGSPGAARAVGSACGANPVALLIPCHRVVASDGSFGGYRWGIERKKNILLKEGAEVAVTDGQT
jgi:AraC family transcriptional regulator, regulatory protein of adaptative response / methylated-DNA-[protein]-cysteine methyltransferase